MECAPEYSASTSDQVLLKLQEICEKSGYQVVQTNGQRVYSPPASMKIPEPPRGSEVFVGKLPKDIYEDVLIPIFEKAGHLYKFRMMLDFSEKTRGYAFATYFSPEDADLAIKTLNDCEIMPNVRMGVRKSVDNCRLFVGNIPVNKTKSEVYDMLSGQVPGITDVFMYMDPKNPERNRGFVFVEFENHRMAALARRQFTPDNLDAWGTRLRVDWADPLPEVDSSVMSQVTILFMKNIPQECTNGQLQSIVSRKVGANIVEKCHKVTNYAFIHFINRRSAEFALRKLSGLFIRSTLVSVEWAIPKNFSKKERLASQLDFFCTSVSPTWRRVVVVKIKANEKENSKSLECSPETNNNGYRKPENDSSGSTSSYGSNFGKNANTESRQAFVQSSWYCKDHTTLNGDMSDVGLNNVQPVEGSSSSRSNSQQHPDESLELRYTGRNKMNANTNGVKEVCLKTLKPSEDTTSQPVSSFNFDESVFNLQRNCDIRQQNPITEVNNTLNDPLTWYKYDRNTTVAHASNTTMGVPSYISRFSLNTNTPVSNGQTLNLNGLLEKITQNHKVTDSVNDN